MTNGSATNTVAMIIPGASKMTWIPASDSFGPKSPVRELYTSTRARPTTTGETESGRSISADSTRLPGNSNRTSRNEMPTPNTRLMSTA
jgi:hypothetical protein